MVRRLLPILALACTSCGIDHYARAQYVSDHAGCAPDVMKERPDFETPGAADSSAFEMVGCNTHELYRCSSEYQGRHRGATFSCTAQPWCETPGCATDYAGAAKPLFVSFASCPIERVSAAFTSTMLPPPPTDVAGDAAREKLWRETQKAKLDGATARGYLLVTVTGCNQDALYACDNRAPSAPTCESVPPVPELLAAPTKSP